MTLPILLIFYVSKWKNNKKHWKIGIWRNCDVIIGRGKSKLGVGLLCTEMIIVCKFHDPSIIGSRDTEAGGPRSPPPPVTDWPKKPSLNRVKMAATCSRFFARVVLKIPFSSNKRGWWAYTTFTSWQNAAYSNKVVFICWVDYALEGSAFILSKCDFSRMFHTERSWHTYQLTVVIVFWSAGFALWCKRIFFDLFWSVKLFYYGWIRVPIFSKVPSGSE